MPNNIDGMEGWSLHRQMKVRGMHSHAVCSTASDDGVKSSGASERNNVLPPYVANQMLTHEVRPRRFSRTTKV